MGSTEDYVKRLVTRREKDIPAEFEAISSEIEKLQKRRELLKEEIFDLGLEIDSLNKRSNEKTFLDMPILVLQEVANYFGQPDEFLCKLSLVSPGLASIITQVFQGKVETAIEEKSFSLLIENQYLDETDIQNISNSACRKLENLAEKCWRFLEEPNLTSVHFTGADKIQAFLDMANRAENPWEVFGRKSFEFEWIYQTRHWEFFTATATRLLESFGNFMPNIYFRYREYSNLSNFTDTVLAKMSKIQRITKQCNHSNSGFVATKFEPRTLDKLCTWAASWSGKELLQLCLPDIGICRQLALGQVVPNSKCFKTLHTVMLKDISEENFGYEKFHDESLAENSDNIEKLQLLSDLNVKKSLTFASKFKSLSHLSLMVRHRQTLDDTIFFEFPRGPLLPHLKSFTIKYDYYSRKFLPLIQIFTMFPSIRNFQIEAVFMSKKNLMQEIKIRLASDARDIHVVNLYHMYSEGRSLADSNIWTLFQHLVSVSFTTLLHKNKNRIFARSSLLIEKYIRADNTESNPRIAQFTSSKICDL